MSVRRTKDTSSVLFARLAMMAILAGSILVLMLVDSLFYHKRMSESVSLLSDEIRVSVLNKTEHGVISVLNSIRVVATYAAAVYSSPLVWDGPREAVHANIDAANLATIELLPGDIHMVCFFTRGYSSGIIVSPLLGPFRIVFTITSDGNATGMPDLANPRPGTNISAYALNEATGKIYTWPGGGHPNVPSGLQRVLEQASQASTEVPSYYLMPSQWINVHNSVHEELLLASSVPVKSKGRHVGFLVMATDIRPVDKFIQSIDLWGGELFIMTNDWLLFSASQGSMLASNSTDIPSQALAENSTSEVIAAGARLLHKEARWNVGGETARVDDICNGRFASQLSVSGVGYFINCQPIKYLLPLHTVLLIPRTSIYLNVDEATSVSRLVLFLVASTVFVVGAVLTISSTTRVSNEVLLKDKLEALNQDYLVARDRANEQAQAAKEANTAKSLFLANMSHELRTPMTGICGYVDLLLEEADIKLEHAESLLLVKLSAYTLLAIVNDLLDLSKIESRRLVLDEEPFNLVALLENVARLFGVTCANKRLELVLDMDEAVPTWVVGDELRLTQVFTNLVSNATKFTPAGHIAIRVKAVRQPHGVALRHHAACSLAHANTSPLEHSGGAGKGRKNDSQRGTAAPKDTVAVPMYELGRTTVCSVQDASSSGQNAGPTCLACKFASAPCVKLHCEVDDSGVGISPRHRTAVLQPFGTSENSVTSRFGGTGLGLAIIKSLVRLMGGVLQFSDKDTPGTLVRFSILLRLMECGNETLEGSAACQVLKGASMPEDRNWGRAPLPSATGSWSFTHGYGSSGLFSEESGTPPAPRRPRSASTEITSFEHSRQASLRVSRRHLDPRAGRRAALGPCLDLFECQMRSPALARVSAASSFQPRELGGAPWRAWLGPSPPGGPARRHAPTVLLAMHGHVARSLVRGWLLAQGLHVLEAADARSLLTLLRSLVTCPTRCYYMSPPATGVPALMPPQGQAAPWDAAKEVGPSEGEPIGKTTACPADTAMTMVASSPSQPDSCGCQLVLAFVEDAFAVASADLPQRVKSPTHSRCSLDASGSSAGDAGGTSPGGGAEEDASIAEARSLMGLLPLSATVVWLLGYGSGGRVRRSLQGVRTPGRCLMELMPLHTLRVAALVADAVMAASQGGKVGADVPQLVGPHAEKDAAAAGKPWSQDSDDDDDSPEGTPCSLMMRTASSLRDMMVMSETLLLEEAAAGGRVLDCFGSSGSTASSHSHSAALHDTGGGNGGARGAVPDARAGLDAATKGAAAAPVDPKTVVHGWRILVAEDSPVVQSFVRTLLTKMGAREVLIVDDGTAAVATVEQEMMQRAQATGAGDADDGPATVFDVILMDLQMSKMGGVDACTAIRGLEARHGGRHFIVAFSGATVAEMRQQCAAAGMDAFVSKPINISELLAVLADRRHFQRAASGSGRNVRTSPSTSSHAISVRGVVEPIPTTGEELARMPSLSDVSPLLSPELRGGGLSPVQDASTVSNSPSRDALSGDSSVAGTSPTQGPTSPAESPLPATKPFHGWRVLYAEDTPLNQRLVRLVLEKFGAHVTIVDNGAKAVERVAASLEAVTGAERLQPQQVDVVLMDLQMPVLDGYGATRQIRQLDAAHGWHTVILALTAHAMQSDAEFCRSCGMDGYLTKPLNVDALKCQLARLGKSKQVSTSEED